MICDYCGCYWLHRKAGEVCQDWGVCLGTLKPDDEIPESEVRKLRRNQKLNEDLARTQS